MTALKSVHYSTVHFLWDAVVTLQQADRGLTEKGVFFRPQNIIGQRQHGGDSGTAITTEHFSGTYCYVLDFVIANRVNPKISKRVIMEPIISLIQTMAFCRC